MTLKKPFKNLTIYLAILMTLFFSVSLTMNQSIEHVSHEEVIYRVDDLDQALTLADEYHLSFNQLSSRGMATFNLTDASNIELLTAMGFAYNRTSQVVAPPWQETTDEDPYLSDQYALEMMDTINAWQVTEGTSNVTVAIIDTGIDDNHDEFVGRISSKSYNSVTETVGISEVIDDQGHGTMVAGIIGAQKNNSTGIAGITSNVQLMVIKANADGKETFQDSAIIEGIYYAADNGADIINLSLGSTYENPYTKEALDYASSLGVIVVAASGNDGTNEAFYPAAFDSTISVSAVGEDTLIAEYSNYGETIDISAPGTDIITTTTNNGYGSVSGTSFAAPQVSGVLALMLSYFTEMERAEIIQRLLLSSVDQGAEGIDDYYGHGITNTNNALTYDFVKVTFETYDGTPIEPVYNLVDTTLKMPDPPKLDDYAFMGWFKDSGLTEAWDPDTDIVTEDMTLYASYNKEYHEVTFISNDQTMDTILVKNGETFTLPTASLDGYNFLGWTTDQENLNPYEESPVYSNLTLYAHFEEIVYYDVHLYIDGELVERDTVESGSTYQADTFEKTGHVFDGWYLDDAYTTAYDPTQTIESNLNIYGKFDPIIYNVTLMVDDQVYDTIDVAYNETPSLPEPTKENAHFIDWYYTTSYIDSYEDTPITENITLYARFENAAYEVTYVINDTSHTDWHLTNELFEPYTPTKEGYTFLGWYYDQDFTNPYEPIYLEEEITLYGKFEIEYYRVVFYDSDRETILYETEVTYGQSVTPPSRPEKNQTISFTYTFSSWSQSTDHITEDIFVYPQYDKSFIPGSITINPGLDSVKVGDTWVDTGLSQLDPFLRLETNQTVDTSSPGKYIVEYEIYDGDTLIVLIKRMVRVTETVPEVTIELNEGITTLPVGGTYVEAGAISSAGEITIDSKVDTSQAGIYTVTYQVTVDNVLFEKTRYVHVVDDYPTSLTQIYWYKEESDTYVA